eukprot:ctg_1090.g337
MYWCGHVHVYERIHPISNATGELCSDCIRNHGTLYVKPPYPVQTVNGIAGRAVADDDDFTPGATYPDYVAKHYSSIDYPYAGYALVQVDHKVLKFTAYNTSGEVIDHFQIHMTSDEHRWAGKNTDKAASMYECSRASVPHSAHPRTRTPERLPKLSHSGRIWIHAGVAPAARRHRAHSLRVLAASTLVAHGVHARSDTLPVPLRRRALLPEQLRVTSVRHSYLEICSFRFRYLQPFDATMAFVPSACFTFCRPSAARLIASTRLATSFLSRGLHAPVTPRPARLMFRMSAEEDGEHGTPPSDSSAAAAPVETESAAAADAAAPTDWSFEGVPEGMDPSEQQQSSRFPDHRDAARRSPRVRRLPLSQLMVGSLIKGRVRSVLPYGAFVDVGTTTDGLLHVSQLSTEYVRDTNEVLKPGDEISVRVISVDPERNEFSLTLLTEEQEKQKQELSAA